MSKMEVEIDGKRRAVTLEELSALVSRKVVSPTDLVWRDDAPCFVVEVVRVPVDDELLREEDDLSGGTSPNDPPLGYYSDERDEMERRRALKKKRTSVKTIIRIVANLYLVGILCVLLFKFFAPSAEEEGESVEKATTEVVEERELAATQSESFEASELVGESSLSPNTKVDQFGWLIEPFDVNTVMLPVDFCGHNFTEIVEGLRWDSFQKPARKATESDADYRTRYDAAERRARELSLVGEVELGSRLAFILPNRKMVEKDVIYQQRGFQSVTTRYIESTKTLFVDKSLLYYSAFLFDARNIAPFLLFGDSKGLALELPKGLKLPNSDGYHWALQGIPQEEYEKRMETLCVLCVVVPDYQGLGDVGLLSAEGCDAIYAREAEFWLYDATDGRVLGKYSFEDTLDQTPHEYQPDNLPPGGVAERVSKRSIVVSD